MVMRSVHTHTYAEEHKKQLAINIGMKMIARHCLQFFAVRYLDVRVDKFVNGLQSLFCIFHNPCVAQKQVIAPLRMREKMERVKFTVRRTRNGNEIFNDIHSKMHT